MRRHPLKYSFFFEAVASKRKREPLEGAVGTLECCLTVRVPMTGVPPAEQWLACLLYPASLSLYSFCFSSLPPAYVRVLLFLKIFLFLLRGFVAVMGEEPIGHYALPREEVSICDPFPVCPAKKLTNAQIDEVVERVYSVSREKKQADKNELSSKYYPQASGVKLSGDQLASSIDRQYSEEMKKREERMKELKEAHLFKSKNIKKVVSQSEFVQRMYHDRIEQMKATEKRLHELYIVPTETKVLHKMAMEKLRTNQQE
eukprot:gene5040-3629_t